MSAHTPGPWVVFKLRLSGMFVIGRPIDERTDAQGDGLAMADTEADANLIAAAPELLEALKLARECIAYCRRAHKDAQSGEGVPVEIILDAAIAKATGAA